MKPSIVIVGSSNTDMVIKAGHLPAAGETVLGGTFFMTQGGKGANQAVAAARLNGEVTFIAKTGADVFGKQSLQAYNNEGIDTKYITVDENSPSGVALITVDENGENCIAVAPGANAALSSVNIRDAKASFEKASIILMQLEIPIETVEYVANLAALTKVKLVLNPAPAGKLSDDLLRKISIITPNIKEAEMLTGLKITDFDSAKEAAKVLADKGIETVIITMGSKGALICDRDVFEAVLGINVRAADTTAAGDIFNGALVVAISEGKSMVGAVEFADAAAAISVTRLGAQASAPQRKETEALLESIRIKA